MRFAELDAVTIDGFGTLLRLVDPVPALVGALREHGVERTPTEVAAAFAAEAAYYRPRALLGRDAESLTELRRECTAVFLSAAGAELEPNGFVQPFVDTLRFDLVPGAIETVRRLREIGRAHV